MQSGILSTNCKILLRKLFGITCFFLFAPFLLIILMVLYIYRCVTEIVLRTQLKDKFVGFLEGSDAIWSVEDASLSVITCVIILKKTAGSTNTTILKKCRKIFNDLSKTANTKLEKLFFHRCQKFGYFYWEKPTKFNPETAIRWLECQNDNCNRSCENVNSPVFHENLSFICNKPLYNNHKPMWEIFIGRRCSKFTTYIKDNPSLFSEDSFNTDVDDIPIVIRFHHSLADGIALLKMLSAVIADEDVMKEQSTIMELKDNTSTVKENNSKIPEKIFLKTKLYSKLNQLYNNITKLYTNINEITTTMILILCFPEMWVTQIVRSMDNKCALYGRHLTGEKLIFSSMVHDGDTSLLMKIKKIRQYTKAKFDDIILTAFAAGLSKYFSRINEIVPDAVSVIIPTRIVMPDEKVVLTNEFSFLIFKSCFVDEDKEDTLRLYKNCWFFNRLQKTESINNKIRNSLEAPLNFLFIKHVFGILPKTILKFFVTSYGCTIGYSNLKGMERKLHIQKYPVSNIKFWIPNKNTTGLCLSIMTYEGKLNMCLLVDKAIIGDMKLIRAIMEETIREIDSAYNNLA